MAAALLAAGCGDERASGGPEARDTAAPSEPVSEQPNGAQIGPGVAEPPPTVVQAASAPTLEQRIASGAVVYFENCASCHQGEGQGIEDEVPPLAQSDYLNEDKARAIQIVVNGLDEDVVVNGHQFANRMPALGLSDDDLSNVLTFVFSQWGNSGQVVEPEEVAAARR